MPGRVHAAVVLGEEVLAVEVVGGVVRGGRSRALLRGHATRVRVAAVEAELEVLARDVALPFVFGAEGRGAAIVREGAGEVFGFGVACARRVWLGGFGWRGLVRLGVGLVDAGVEAFDAIEGVDGLCSSGSRAAWLVGAAD